jgi:hypothetical protein
MKLSDVKKIYNERVIKLGEAPESLGWRSWEQQRLRFEIIFSQMQGSMQLELANTTQFVWLV